MPGKIYPITSLPGISREGTDFYGQYYIDGDWVRFYRGKPRKMGGYLSLNTTSFNNIPRGTYVVPKVPNFDVYVGDADHLQFLPVDQLGSVTGPVVDRTPLSLVANQNNMWQFDTMFDTNSNSSILVAHCAPNLASINNDAETPIFYGDSFSSSRLIPTGISVSGGIFSLHPYLCMFGNAGNVKISAANNPTQIIEDSRVCAQKIVAGMPTRGGNSSPAGLLWSLDSLIRVTQVGVSDVVFRFDSIATQTSILSSESIIEYNGVYYWATADCFLMYGGTVQEVPNQLNLRYFFRDLNYQQRQKVWATKIPAWGEIWWHYPSGESNECDHAVIYNVRERTWYDTASARSSGYFEQVFGFPVWTGNVQNAHNAYTIWEHEIGKNRVEDGIDYPIRSFFKTGDVSYVASGPGGEWIGVDRQVYLYQMEPDFAGEEPLSRLEGSMTLTVEGRAYANAPNVSSGPLTFDSTTGKLDIKQQRREMHLTFESNEINGFYEMGQPLLDFRIGDARP